MRLSKQIHKLQHLQARMQTQVAALQRFWLRKGCQKLHCQRGPRDSGDSSTVQLSWCLQVQHRMRQRHTPAQIMLTKEHARAMQCRLRPRRLQQARQCISNPYHDTQPI